MKKSLLKNNLKEIVKTRRRFLSIMVMAFLGVGFFAGLSASSPDMLDTLDKYTDNNNMYDISIISTLGLTDEDINSLNDIDGIEYACGIQTKDSLAILNEKESVCKVIEYNEEVNVPEIISGRLPINPSECLLDSRYTITDNMENYIGKKIILQNDDKDTKDNPIFTQKEFTIVGIVDSPIYISNERGNTSIGNGTVGYYIYVDESVISLDYYTEIGIMVEDTKSLVTNSAKYLDKVNTAISKIEEIKETRQDARYNSLINEATQKLDDAQAEYDKNKLDVEIQIQDAENQINQAKLELESNENTIKITEQKLVSEEKEANTKFSSAEAQLSEYSNTLAEKDQELENSKLKLSEAQSGLEQLEALILKTQTTLDTLLSQKEALIEAGQTETGDIDALIYQSTVALENLNIQKKNAQTQFNEYQTQIIAGESELQTAKATLESQKTELTKQKSNAYSQIASGKAQIESAKQDLENGKIELAEKEQELLDNKQEAERELQDAQSKISDAKDEISQIEKATWYIQDRMDNIGYSNIFDAIKTMSNISKVFPVIFYLVAVLISLTSMTRMIEEERIEIGTLKSLGYTNSQIISKYVLYSAIACILGGVLGMSIGFYLLPTIVWSLYSTIYTIPNFILNYQLGLGITGTLLAFLCIGGATIVVAYKELREMPAVLMRPKAPKNGKKIFLEKISFIWNSLNFSKKITVRNIFRYKKRAIMTIVGIAGCTGLMVTGFGIKDSIVDIPFLQYGGIFKYTATVTISDTEKITDIEDYLNNNTQINVFSKICAGTATLKNDNGSYDVNLFVPESNELFKEVCVLEEYENDKKIDLNQEGIVITDKVAEALKVNVGDKITLIDSDNIEYTFTVSNIAKNYVSHYVYMSKDFYEENIKTYKTNMLLLKTVDNISDKDLNKISEDLLKVDGVASVSVVSTLISSIEDMLGTLNYVVVILVVASALLAFVVLYNLANINIGERQRELATLKVLGFYDKEVDNYINKENIIFTIIGILLGLVFGFFLTSAVVISVEIDKLRFIRQIQPVSYIYASIITIIFSFIVNKVIHFTLKKIDMIESLKSVE